MKKREQLLWFAIIFAIVLLGSHLNEAAADVTEENNETNAEIVDESNEGSGPPTTQEDQREANFEGSNGNPPTTEDNREEGYWEGVTEEWKDEDCWS